MANFKRKRSKRQIRCSLCTPHRWKGNTKDRHSFGDYRRKAVAEENINEHKDDRYRGYPWGFYDDYNDYDDYDYEDRDYEWFAA